MASAQHPALQRWLADLHTASSSHSLHELHTCLGVLRNARLTRGLLLGKPFPPLQQAKTTLPVALPLTYIRQLHCVQLEP